MTATHLVKGQNSPLPAGDVTISVQVAAPADLSALLVTERGTVRSDNDFVFYNNPAGQGVRLTSAPHSALAISTAAVPAEIAEVRAVVSLDDQNATFGGLPAPVATVSDAAGNPLCHFRIDGLGAESVVIAVELYRRGGAWKVRAVGQGYAGGFAALVTDHGIVVDDAPAYTGEPSVAPQPAHPSTPAPSPAPVAAGYTPASQPGYPPPPGYGSSPGAGSGFPQQAPPGPVAPGGFGYPPPAPPAYHHPPRSQSPIRTAPGEERLSLEKRQQLDLRKQAVVKVLLTKGAQGARARIVLVIDKTGSMTSLYRKGVLKRVVQRMIPVAIQLDDDGRLEPYLYANNFAALPPVTVDRADEWCDTFLHMSGKRGGIDYKHIGGVNNEIPIMREIMDTLDPASDPTLVLFFTDGGFHEKRKITALMREASTLPIFWQFIGLGRADYGLLRALDTMDGRAVDNAGFFAVDDIDRITDDDLYQRLLGEFPDWLRVARSAGILR